MMTTKSALEHLVCTSCGKKHDSNQLQGLCSCGKVLFAKYDLERAKISLSKNIGSRRYDLWRMEEIMPIRYQKNMITLGEGWTPLLYLPRLGKEFNLSHLFLKDEGKNPTGTFKSRGLCAAVAKAKELGVEEFVIPTAGNAGAALSAYAARTNSPAHIFMPKESSILIQKEVKAMGGKLNLIDGLISDAGKLANQKAKENGWFDVSTLKEPYRVEGKKTMGLELAEQSNWNLEQTVIVYPTGGGTGIIGMWKAFQELQKMGILTNDLPQMVSVQVDTCAPVVKAFQEGKDQSDFWEGAKTIAAGLRVPKALGDYLILKAIRESKGTALTVSDKEIQQFMRLLAKKEGIMLSPEAAATLGATKKMKENGFIDHDTKVIMFGTGSGLTTPEVW